MPVGHPGGGITFCGIKERELKHSLRVKTTLILTLCLAALIALCWVANEVFLEKYYQSNKVDGLCDSFHEVNSLVGTDSVYGNDDAVDGIEHIEAAKNVNVYIISIFPSYDGRAGVSFDYPETVDSDGRGMNGYERYKRIISALQKYIFDTGANPSRDEKSRPRLLLSDSENYDVYKIFDPDVDCFYIDLVGFLDNGCIVLIRASYENIEESAAISSRFLALAGIITVAVGTVLMFMFSRSFTRPLLELADISDRMSGLDFEMKYTGRRRDEIGRLGESINKLSGRLEQTISELKSANLELEKDIAKKTQIDEMRKEFLSNVSHELKTPIALIQGYAEGLQDNVNDDPESRSFYCEVIIDEARKMNMMVRKLLSLNEIECGNVQLELGRFDIVSLAASVASSLDILAKQDGINIVFNEHEPVFVWADENLIEEVLTNYLSNAIHHAGGQKIIDLSFRTEEDRVRVSVFNTGSQIAEEELDRIWDKFYKIDKARTREYGGSGIGLSIVKAIMEQHNQGFGVENHSSGVEFWFELKTNTEELS